MAFLDYQRVVKEFIMAMTLKFIFVILVCALLVSHAMDTHNITHNETLEIKEKITALEFKCELNDELLNERINELVNVLSNMK